MAIRTSLIKKILLPIAILVAVVTIYYGYPIIANFFKDKGHRNKTPITAQLLEKELNSPSAKMAILNFRRSGDIRRSFEDISCSIISHQSTSNNSRKVPLQIVTARCSINAQLLLPIATQTVVGIMDIEQHKFFPLDIFEKYNPTVMIEKLRRDGPDYLFLIGEAPEDEIYSVCTICNDIDDINLKDLSIWRIDENEDIFPQIYNMKSYELHAIDREDGSGIYYVDIPQFTLSDWIDNVYRNLTITIYRHILSDYNSQLPYEFNKRVATYRLNEKNELFLTKLVQDGQLVIGEPDSAGREEQSKTDDNKSETTITSATTSDATSNMSITTP